MSGIFDQIINYSPPLIVSGTVNYKGTWNASTNNPTLNSSPAASTKGDYYVVSTAGTQFGITFAIGDWIISNGTAWEKVDLTDAVSSVFGRTGAVVGVSTDYSAVGLTNTAIGASNPSTGAFTTVTASSTIAATGAVTGSNLSGTNTGDQTTITGNAGTATALQTARTIGGSSFDGTANVTSFPVPGAIGVTTPAAANFTSIGVTTQGTGAFTTLSATGALSTTIGGDTITLGAGGVGYLQTFSRADANYIRASSAGGYFVFETGGANNRAVINDTGLAVTGTLSATGKISSNLSTGAQFGVGGASSGQTVGYLHAYDTTTTTLLVFDRSDGAVAGSLIYDGSGLIRFGTTTAHNLELMRGGTTIASVSSAGLTVTGALSSTGVASFAGDDKISLSGVGATDQYFLGANYINANGTESVTTASRGSWRSVMRNATTLEYGIDWRAASAGAGTFTRLLTVTSAGNVGIGTSSIDSKLTVKSADNANANAITIYNKADTAGAYASIGSYYDTGNLNVNSQVRFGNEVASGGSSYLAFATGTSTSAIERARITSSGNLLVGTTGSSGGKLVVAQTASSTNAILVDIQSSTTKFAEFTFTGSNVGSISYNGTLTVYSTTSDYRLKDITGPLTDSGSFIDALKPKVGTWKSNGDKFVGFIAHEFAEVSPSSVIGEKDAVDAEGKPVYQGIQAGTAEVIANLVAELQSVRQRLSALEA